MKMILAMLVLLTATSALAEKNIWRDCGIGALVFTETKWAAVTSNITWDLGITASTSYSSSEDQCSGKGASTAKFIHQNYAQIEEETVKGSGEHLTAMLQLVNCGNTSHDEIIGSLRSKIKSDDLIQNSSTGVEKSRLYYNTLMNVLSSDYSNKCTLI